MKEIKINKNLIGDKQNLYITFECGPTHNGFKSAKRLIKIAKNSGANAVKFQSFKPENLLSDKKTKIDFKFLDKHKKLISKKLSLFFIFKKRNLKNSEWLKLKKYADKLKIDFFLTIGDDDGLELAKKMNCKSIKIASSDINHIPFLEKVSKENFVLQIDTGNSTINEIEKAIKIFKKNKKNNIIIHYCPSGYPAENDGANFNYIPFLKRKFKLPVGYSDHFISDIYSHVAIASGANLIEKTLSENIYQKNIEHSMSIQSDNAKDFVKKLHNTKMMFSKKMIFLTDKIIKKRSINRRSAYLKVNKRKNEKLKIEDIIFLRPGDGIGPDKINSFMKMRIKSDLKKKTKIQLKHFI